MDKFKPEKKKNLFLLLNHIGKMLPLFYNCKKCLN